MTEAQIVARKGSHVDCVTSRVQHSPLPCCASAIPALQGSPAQPHFSPTAPVSLLSTFMSAGDGAPRQCLSLSSGQT